MRKIISISLTLLFVACQTTKKDNQKIVGNAFGTTYSIIYNSSISPKDLQVGVDSIIDAFNKSVSTYDPESLISKWNAGDTTVVVDPIFKEVFLMSKEVHQNTKGYFDPTVGVLRNVYGFGEVEAMEIVQDKDLDSIMEMVGFDKLRLQADDRISKEHPMIYLDFNAIAKGYGVDRLAAYLDTKGISNYLVEISGELYAKGINPERNASWMVGIENVDSDLGNRSYSHLLPLKNAGLAASGNYRKFRIDAATGKHYVHTINPITGSAERTDVSSATVIAETCAMADAYATAFMALGLERSKAVLEKLEGIEAYLTILSDSDEEEKVYATPGMKLLLMD